MIKWCSLYKSYIISIVLVFLSIAFGIYSIYEKIYLTYKSIFIFQIIIFILSFLLFKFLKRTMVLLKNILSLARNVSVGNFEDRIILTKEKGLLGDLGDAINDSVDYVDVLIREIGASMDATIKGHYYRKILPKGLRGTFEKVAFSINGMLSIVSKKTDDLKTAAHLLENNIFKLVKNVEDRVEIAKNSAEVMLEFSNQSKSQSEHAENSTKESLNSISNVANSISELSKSIQEISIQINQSNKIIKTAYQDTTNTRQTIHTLNSASEQITYIVKLIGNIAEKTNLLALNSTIEAARAGEMGKGFSVVASEIKNLASQTMDATQKITDEITKITNLVSQTVNNIDQVSKTMLEMSDISNSISAAIEEQSVTTKEISNNMTLTSNSSKEMEEVANSMKQKSKEGLESSCEVKKAITEVKDNINVLTKELSDFIVSIKNTN
jgi:methyl-accepting chemotaxis protein